MAVNISSNQRLALLATLALSTLILLLHFPFDGYVTQHSYTVPSFTACPKGDLKERLRELGSEEFNKALTACQEKLIIAELPLSGWRSNGAISDWLASPTHTLVAIISIITFGIACFFAMRPPQKTQH
ncbi:hypothetical protein [Pseudomonas monsensis]